MNRSIPHYIISKLKAVNAIARLYSILLDDASFSESEEKRKYKQIKRRRPEF